MEVQGGAPPGAGATAGPFSGILGRCGPDPLDLVTSFLVSSTLLLPAAPGQSFPLKSSELPSVPGKIVSCDSAFRLLLRD